MTLTRFLDLVVTSGPDAGMRYSIEEGTYRIIGRYDDFLHPTQILSAESDHGLNPDQQERVEKHLASHPHSSHRKQKTQGPDILLSDPSISRSHAMVIMDESGAQRIDLISKNGTHVNQTLVSDIPLSKGDVISLGNTQLIVQMG